MEDARGISRGGCKSCLTSCVRYAPPSSGLKCSQCGCPPAGHSRLASSIQVQETSTPDMNQASFQAPGSVLNIQSDSYVCTAIDSICGFPSCSQMVDFDVNSGVENLYCRYHMNVNDRIFVEDIELDDYQLGNEYEEDYEGTPFLVRNKSCIPHVHTCLLVRLQCVARGLSNAKRRLHLYNP